jgi:hypothetical protein
MDLQLNFDQQDDDEPNNPVASVKTASQARLSLLNIDDESNPVMLQIGRHPRLELQPSIPATEIDVQHSISVTSKLRNSSKALVQPRASFVGNEIEHQPTSSTQDAELIKFEDECLSLTNFVSDHRAKRTRRGARRNAGSSLVPEKDEKTTQYRAHQM